MKGVSVERYGDAINELYRVRVGGLMEKHGSVEWGTLRYSDKKSPASYLQHVALRSGHVSRLLVGWVNRILHVAGHIGGVYHHEDIFCKRCVS